MTLSRNLPIQWIEKIRSLPVLPQVAVRITERIQSPTATLTEIADLIRSDVGLTSNILRLANSSYYSVPGGVSDIPKALQYLGFTTIAQSVLTSSFLGSFKTKGIREFPLSPFWLHSFAVGILSEITAHSLQLKNTSDAFLGGLMHDVGKLVFLELVPEELSKIINYGESHQLTFRESETALGLPSHTTLGAEFGKYWNLPAAVVESIRFHHGCEQDLDSKNMSHQTQIIQWANLWVHGQKIGSSGNVFIHDQALEAQKLAIALKINSTQLQAIEKNFHREFEKAGAMLNGH